MHLDVQRTSGVARVAPGCGVVHAFDLDVAAREMHVEDRDAKLVLRRVSIRLPGERDANPVIGPADHARRASDVDRCQRVAAAPRRELIERCVVLDERQRRGVGIAAIGAIEHDLGTHRDHDRHVVDEVDARDLLHLAGPVATDGRPLEIVTLPLELCRIDQGAEELARFAVALHQACEAVALVCERLAQQQVLANEAPPVLQSRNVLAILDGVRAGVKLLEVMRHIRSPPSRIALRQCREAGHADLDQRARVVLRRCLGPHIEVGAREVTHAGRQAIQDLLVGAAGDQARAIDDALVAGSELPGPPRQDLVDKEVAKRVIAPRDLPPQPVLGLEQLPELRGGDRSGLHLVAPQLADVLAKRLVMADAKQAESVIAQCREHEARGRGCRRIRISAAQRQPRFRRTEDLEEQHRALGVHRAVGVGAGRARDGAEIDREVVRLQHVLAIEQAEQCAPLDHAKPAILQSEHGIRGRSAHAFAMRRHGHRRDRQHRAGGCRDVDGLCGPWSPDVKTIGRPDEKRGAVVGPQLVRTGALGGLRCTGGLRALADGGRQQARGRSPGCRIGALAQLAAMPFEELAAAGGAHEDLLAIGADHGGEIARPSRQDVVTADLDGVAVQSNHEHHRKARCHDDIDERRSETPPVARELDHGGDPVVEAIFAGAVVDLVARLVRAQQLARLLEPVLQVNVWLAGEIRSELVSENDEVSAVRACDQLAELVRMHEGAYAAVEPRLLLVQRRRRQSQAQYLSRLRADPDLPAHGARRTTARLIVEPLLAIADRIESKCVVELGGSSQPLARRLQSPDLPLEVSEHVIARAMRTCRCHLYRLGAAGPGSMTRKAPRIESSYAAPETMFRKLTEIAAGPAFL
ncbi:MAG TPA: hypothetical protein VFD36_00300 [Kofleriaceae bacterium]|nr:hypothetical protein [Kofleriaceae bacterium]